jgi:hypothetical protein
MGSVFLSLLLPLSNYKIEVWNKPQNTVIFHQFENPVNATIPASTDTSTVMYVIGKDHPEIVISEDSDSLRDVLVNTNVMHTEKITITKNINVNKSADQELSNVLFIIDGVEHREKDAMLVVDPADIESINVLKDKKMMKKYTEKRL